MSLTPNVNESIHSPVSIVCPQICIWVATIWSLAVICFNDRWPSLTNICDVLDMLSREYRWRYLQKKDKATFRRSTLKSSTEGKEARHAMCSKEESKGSKKKESCTQQSLDLFSSPPRLLPKASLLAVYSNKLPTLSVYYPSTKSDYLKNPICVILLAVMLSFISSSNHDSSYNSGHC